MDPPPERALAVLVNWVSKKKEKNKARNRTGL